MRKNSTDYEVWRKNSIVLGADDEATSVATGNSIELLQEASVLHLIIRTAMATSNMKYQFKKMERKS